MVLLTVSMLVATSAFAMAASVKSVPSLSAVPDQPIKDAEWTIMVYLDADNSLESSGLLDLIEMEVAGSGAGVNVIVMFDGLSLVSGTHWFYIGQNSDHILDDGTIVCDCDKIAGRCPGEQNMGAASTLTYFIKTATAYAPAQKYLLDMWDHGGGWWGVCYDETTVTDDGSTDRLTMDEVAQGVKDSGVHMDVIAYDACFMGMVEVAFENREIADYMVGSITTVPGLGFDYTGLINTVKGLTTKNPVSVSKAVAHTYVAYYSAMCSGAGIGGYPYVSCSVFDLDEVVNLVGVGSTESGMDALGKALLDYADDYDLRGAIQSSEAMTPQLQFMGEQFPFIDIGYFATLLGEKIPDIATLAGETFKLLDAAVIYCESVVSDSEACINTYGMSVYYTICWDHLYANYLTSNLDFVSLTSWDEFLFAFSQVYVEE
jgi:hypothetical protein